MANRKGSRQLKHIDRIRLETLHNADHKIVKIAEMLRVHRSTIYNELKRGRYEHLNSDYTTDVRYSSDIAQQRFEENLKVRGTQLKIGSDIKLADYIESKIINDNYSPDAIIGELTREERWGEFQTKICTTTAYSYIDKGIFLRVTNNDLPVKKNKKRRYNRVKMQKRSEHGESIENRPDETNDRIEFGHWEMDSVIGKRGRSKNTLLTLTERKTRAEIIFKLSDHSAEAVVGAIDRLEKRWGEMFKSIFKSITVDNGTEFARCAEIERSITGNGKRTKMYYCHPYSSWERGTNEVTNKMIRRKIPKGTDFDSWNESDICALEEWINTYPRRIHGYRSAHQLFEEEVRRIG